MPNVMAALPNIAGALCATPQSFANAHYLTAVHSNAAKCEKAVEISWDAPH